MKNHLLQITLLEKQKKQLKHLLSDKESFSQYAEHVKTQEQLNCTQQELRIYVTDFIVEQISVIESQIETLETELEYFKNAEEENEM